MDETVIVSLKFSGNRLAVFTCSTSFLLPNDAIVIGTKGTIKVLNASNNYWIFRLQRVFLCRPLTRGITRTEFFKIKAIFKK